ncbi:N-acetylglucosamine kinase [Lysinibacillus sp. NPDC097279]|uniref:N-acetylglucosamine kinase n=1 Tax=Lysinibacillus sp. NPDC097279 TaxID=3364143 RepID=UPI0037F4018D
MYVLAIDGGGTKTIATISTYRGQMMALAETGKSNPTSMSLEQFTETITELINDLKRQRPHEFQHITKCHAGLSGVTENNNEKITHALLTSLLPRDCQLALSNDGLNALYAGTLGQPGIVQISGTGAITLSIDSFGKIERTAGWGYIFDDEGSGYDIGIRTLKAVFKAFDKRGSKTLLTAAVLEYFQLQSVPQIIEVVYGEGHPRDIISPLSKVAIACAKRGDAEANTIINQVCHVFYQSVEACYKKNPFAEKRVKVVLAGGVFNELGLFIEKLEAIDKKNRNQYDFMGAYSLPVGGAALAALKLPRNEAKIFIDQFNVSMKEFLTN